MKTRLNLDNRFWQILAFAAFVKVMIIGIAAVSLSTPWVGHIIADIWLWIDPWKLAKQGAIPYVNYTREYPVGAGILYWIMTPFIDLTEGRWQSILLTHSLFMAIADIAGAGLLYLVLQQINRSRATLLTIIFVLTPTVLLLSPMRFDSYIVFLVILGYWFHLNDKPLWATFTWSLGCWFKFFPIFFILVQEIRAFQINKNRKQWWKSILVFLGVAALVNLPFMFLCFQKNGNLANWWFPYGFWANRSITWDTLMGVLGLWLGGEPPIAVANNITVVLITLFLVMKPAMKLEYKGVLLCVTAILFNRIYSPQFQMWFYPFLLVIAAKELKQRWLLFVGLYIALDLTNVIVFPFSFTAALEEMKGFAPLLASQKGGLGTIIFSTAIVVRALLLMILMGLIFTSHPKEEKNVMQLSLDI